MKRKKLIWSIIVILLAIALLKSDSINGLKTSVKSRFPGDFKASLKDYKSLKLLSSQGHFAVPGMQSTNISTSLKGKEGFCDAMTPQGICTTEDYILITAYCRAEEYLKDLRNFSFVPQNGLKFLKDGILGHHENHNSVIYVVDKKTREYLTTLELSDVNHVGGVTYDGKYVWIAKSSKYELSAISIDDIKKAVDKKLDTVKVNYYDSVACDRMASFVTYYDNRLWVGFCNGAEKGNGVLDGFEISKDKNGRLSLISSKELSIPETANGAAFAKINGEVCLCVNLSDGRGSAVKNTDSKMCLYQVDVNKNSDISGYKSYGKYVLPPLVEEICVDGSEIYFLFESGASAYSTVAFHRCYRIVDNVCIGRVKDLFYWQDSDYTDDFESSVTTEYSKVSTPTQAAAVPVNTIQATSKAAVETLYNPYTASMTYNISKGVFQKSVDPQWLDRLSAYGFMQLYSTQNFGDKVVAKRMVGTNELKEYKLNANAIMGMKKMYYNGKLKYAIMLSFRGSNILKSMQKDSGIKEEAPALDTVPEFNPVSFGAVQVSEDLKSDIFFDFDESGKLVNSPTDEAVAVEEIDAMDIINEDKEEESSNIYLGDLSCDYHKSGMNKGFRDTVKTFISNTKSVKFMVNRKKVTFETILKDMKKKDSKYVILATGYGTGGSLASAFTSYGVKEMEIDPLNIGAYTYGSCPFVNDDYKYDDQNVINVINEDDFMQYVGGDNYIGKMIDYDADSLFRQEAYDSNMYQGETSEWWSTEENAYRSGLKASTYKSYGDIVLRLNTRRNLTADQVGNVVTKREKDKK